MHCIILNSIAPFSITTKPIVFGPSTIISVLINEDSRGTPRIVFDSNEIWEFNTGDKLNCTAMCDKLELIGTFENSEGAAFAKKLKTLLGWK